MTDRTYLVAEIKAALQAKGQTFTTNEDAFGITCRVAWALRSDGAMLVTKTAAQNGAVYQGVKYSHDVIAFIADDWIDCLVNAGPPSNENRPAWSPTGKSTARLVTPFDLDASVDLPPVDSPAVPDLATQIDLLRKDLAQLNEILKLDTEVMMGALSRVQSDLGDLKVEWAKGLSGSIFGLRVTLKP